MTLGRRLAALILSLIPTAASAAAAPTGLDSARVVFQRNVDAIRDQKVTNTFGSPALWKRVAACCTDSHLIELPTLRRILIAGAPVPPPLIEQLHRVLSPAADVHTPYGATESLPVSTISGREVIGTKARRHGGTK